MLGKIFAYFIAGYKPRLALPIGCEYIGSCIPFVNFLINWPKQFPITETKNPSS